MLVARYDRNAALLDGRVPIEGVDLDITEVNDDNRRQRLGQSGAYDAWEAYAGRYLMDFEAGRRDFVAIPVFVKRNFRHSSIYVRCDAPRISPADLGGRRIGIQHWSTTAAIWAKGILAEDYGLDLHSVTWVQTSPDSFAWERPLWLRLEEAPPGRDLADMLRDGEIDAAITSVAWVPYEHPDLAFLLPDYREREREYFARTRIFPVMHTLVVRTSLLEAQPSLGGLLFEAWTVAKEACFDRLERERLLGTSMWFAGLLEEERLAVGERDTYPWGLRRSRHEIAKLVDYALDQGIVTVRYEPEALFHPSTWNT